MTRSKPYSLVSFSFWRAYLITMRPYLLFVSGAAGLVGLAIPEDTDLSRILIAFAAFTLAYGFGQALTDVFQTDTDSISSPYRPLTQGKITKTQVLAVSCAGLLGCAGVFSWCNPLSLAPSAIAVVGLASYTWFKRRWWGGPLWNSWIVALLVVIGVLCAGTDWQWALNSRLMWSAAASAFFSYAVFVLLGYFKDISADRATGYQTLPVVAGWRASLVASAVYAAMGLVSASFVFLEVDFLDRPWGAADILGGLFFLYSAALYVIAHLDLLANRKEDETQAHHAISHTVRAFVALQLGEAVVLNFRLGWIALFYYVLFELLISVRPEKTQV